MVVHYFVSYEITEDGGKTRRVENTVVDGTPFKWLHQQLKNDLEGNTSIKILFYSKLSFDEYRDYFKINKF